MSILVVILAMLAVSLVVVIPSASATQVNNNSNALGAVLLPNLKVIKNKAAAGYAIANGTNLGAAQGTFNVPTVTCISGVNSTELVEVGLLNNASSKYINGAIAAVGMVCYKGTLIIEGLAEWGNGGSSSSQFISGISSGNVIKVSISLKSSGDKIVMKDVTTGNSFSKSFSGATANIGSWFVISASIPVPKFTTVHFTGAEAAQSGKTLQPISKFSSNLYEAILVNPNTGHVLAKPSALSSTGTSFTVVWKTSQ